MARDPGGSSAGTGAAVAANLAAVGIGEDTGGSIRVPASFDNLVGVRVTPGLISRKGLSPLVVFQDTAGPMGRTVKDTAIVLDAIVGYDPRDPYTSAITIAGHKAATRKLSTDALNGARMGVLSEAFGSDDDPYCAEVNAVMRAAIEAIARGGCGDRRRQPAGPDGPHHRDLAVHHALATRHQRVPRGTAESGVCLARPDRHRRQIPQASDLITDIMTGPLNPADDPEYYRKLAAREAFQRAVVNIIAANQLDGMRFPSCQVLPPTREELNTGRWTVPTFPTNTLIAAQTWMPSICLPAGFTSAGVPVGMEMIVPPYHEPDLFRLGYAFEQATHHRRAPAAAPPL